MRIAFVLQRAQPDDPSPHVSPVMDEVIARLWARGVRVDLVVPENACVELGDVRPLYDLYVLKSKTPLALSLAGALAVAGAQVINTVESCNLVRDKIVCTALLAARGVPVPPSWATGQAARFLPLLREGPLWVKPYRGSKGEGVLRIDNSAELERVQPRTDTCGQPLPLFAQEAVPSEAGDLKVYLVGERAWAISRPWPARTIVEKTGKPAYLSPAIEATALACGRALGLEIYGVDFLVQGDDFFVVDVNAFPGFKGPVGAAACIADYVYECALRPDGRDGEASGHLTPAMDGQNRHLPRLADHLGPPVPPVEVGVPT